MQFLVGVLPNDFFLHELLPNLLANLFVLFVGEVSALSLHLHLQFDDFALRFHFLLEVLDGEFVTIDFADLIAFHSRGGFDGTEELFSDKSKKGEAEDADQQCAFASDFL